MSDPTALARQILADALQVSQSDLGDAPAIGQIKSWDSLAHMRLVLALETHRDRPLDAMEIVSIGTLDDIAALLRA